MRASILVKAIILIPEYMLKGDLRASIMAKLILLVFIYMLKGGWC